MVAGGVTEADLDAFMRKHQRQAKLVFNASVQKILAPNELHFLTTKGHCDCGTALGRKPRDRKAPSGDDVSKRIAKGWSQAKIDRWLAGKEKAASRAPRASSIDSVAFWAALVRDLRAALSPASVGVLLHFYSGPLGGDKFGLRRVEIAPPLTIENALDAMSEDELTMLP
jgi:hypothetical protein